MSNQLHRYAFNTDIYRLTYPLLLLFLLRQFCILQRREAYALSRRYPGQRLLVWPCGMCHTCWRLISALFKSVLTARMSHDSATCRHDTRHAQYQTDTMHEGPREMNGLRIWTVPSLAPGYFLLYNPGTVLRAWRRFEVLVRAWIRMVAF